MEKPKSKKLFGPMKVMPDMSLKKPKKPGKPESMEAYHKRRMKKML